MGKSQTHFTELFSRTRWGRMIKSLNVEFSEHTTFWRPCSGGSNAPQNHVCCPSPSTLVMAPNNYWQRRSSRKPHYRLVLAVRPPHSNPPYSSIAGGSSSSKLNNGPKIARLFGRRHFRQRPRLENSIVIPRSSRSISPSLVYPVSPGAAAPLPA